MADRRGPPKEHKALDTKEATEVLHLLLDEGGWLSEDLPMLAASWNALVSYHEYCRPEVALRYLQTLSIVYLQGSGFDMSGFRRVLGPGWQVCLQMAVVMRVVGHVIKDGRYKSALALVPDKQTAWHLTGSPDIDVEAQAIRELYAQFG